ncbi:APC family permease [Patescibacteria group bacterium]|nr:APC family permease [Patescibacteria group bacterium]MBU1673536.1 APC family permease [Patescibacteria group bacterium]MBU1963720.1 APC family permease [Patescibacteria group bacterium]
MKKAAKHYLTLFSLVMINISLIAALRGLPTMAEYGFSIIFFLILAVIVFLIPVSLISAELATGWPTRGGIYVWVKEALGERWGFVAIWTQWIQNVVFYPTALAATAATLAFMYNPQLATNPIYTIVVIFVVYWGATFINFRGMKISSIITNFGTVMGVLVPGILLVVCAFIWLNTGHESAIVFTWASFVPDLSNFSNIVFLTGVFLFFAGMEVSAVHAKEVKNPKKDYPKAIFISSFIIVAIFALGSLAIAIITPANEISLTAGIMQTFLTVFSDNNVLWLVPVIALIAVPGMVAQILNWIAGPSKALLMTAEDGCLPPFFQHTNKHGMQTNIFITQGVIVSIISLVFVVLPSVSSSFWILTALAAQMYLVVYLFMFTSAIVLKYKRPDVKRAYTVPGGKIGMIIVGGVGIAAAIFAFFLGYVPPAELETGSIYFYVGFLAIGLILMCGAPLVIYQFRKPEWVKKTEPEKNK